MNDNVIPVGNTPIFDKMVRELEARGRSYESLVGKGPIGLRPVQKVVPIPAPEAAEVPEPIAERSRIEENVDPYELLEKGIEFPTFVHGLAKKFREQYPNYEIINVRTRQEVNGTVTVILTDSGDQKTEKDVIVKPLCEVSFEDAAMGDPDEIGSFIREAVKGFQESNPNATITNTIPKKNPDGSVTVIVEAVDPKMTENTLSGRQLEIYKDSITSSDTVSVEQPTQQKDESVATVPHEVTHRVPGRVNWVKQKPQPDHIGEDTAEALYMKPSAWGSNEE